MNQTVNMRVKGASKAQSSSGGGVAPLALTSPFTMALSTPKLLTGSERITAREGGEAAAVAWRKAHAGLLYRSPTLYARAALAARYQSDADFHDLLNLAVRDGLTGDAQAVVAEVL